MQRKLKQPDIPHKIFQSIRDQPQIFIPSHLNVFSSPFRKNTKASTHLNVNAYALNTEAKMHKVLTVSKTSRGRNQLSQVGPDLSSN